MRDLDIDGYVLTGGASSRMGTDKAALIIGGKSFSANAAAALLPMCKQVFTVGGDASVSGVAHITDIRHPLSTGNKAAINGLYTALSHCTSRFAVVLACDMPFVTKELVLYLAKHCETLMSGRNNAVIPLDLDVRAQPLCAIYAVQSCLTELRKLSGPHVPRVQEFVDRLHPLYVSVSESPDFACDAMLFSNVNTPEDLKRASRSVKI